MRLSKKDNPKKCPNCKRKVTEHYTRWDDKKVYVKEKEIDADDGEKMVVKFCSRCGYIYSTIMYTEDMKQEEEYHEYMCS